MSRARFGGTAAATRRNIEISRREKTMLERRIRLTTLVSVAATAWTAAAAAQPEPLAPVSQPGASVASAAASQPAAPAAPAPAPAGAPANVLFLARGAPIMPFGGNIDIVAGEGSVMGKVVTNKPYSARSITESTQMLADGNRIVNRNEARIYRDSAGRTRREQTLNALGVWQAGNEPVTMVTINDPVAGTSYVLNPADRTARQVQRFKLATNAASDSAGRRRQKTSEIKCCKASRRTARDRRERSPPGRSATSSRSRSLRSSDTRPSSRPSCCGAILIHDSARRPTTWWTWSATSRRPSSSRCRRTTAS
jgi:hypothetical protein